MLSLWATPVLLILLICGLYGNASNYFVCPYYSVFHSFDAQLNYATCNFTACAGELTIQGCDSCSGDQFIRLFQMDGGQVAENDDGCSISTTCSSLLYTVPTGCHSFMLKQGCSSEFLCEGEMTVSGQNVSIVEQPSNIPEIANTVFCPEYSARRTSSALVRYDVCNFTACGDFIEISGCGEGCRSDQLVRLYEGDNLLAVADEGCTENLCAYHVYENTGGRCRNFWLAEGCYQDASCGGIIAITAINASIVLPPAPSGVVQTDSCYPYSGSTLNGFDDRRVVYSHCNITACWGDLTISNGDFECGGRQSLTLLNSINGDELVSATGSSSQYCASLTQFMPPGCHNYTILQACYGSALNYYCTGALDVTGYGVVVHQPVRQERYVFNSAQCPPFTAFYTDSARINYADCAITACEGALFINNCDSSCSGKQYIRLFDAYGAQVTYGKDGCSLIGNCAAVNYDVPPGCHNFTLRQGCDSLNTACSGHMTVTGTNVTVHSTEPESPPVATRFCDSFDFSAPIGEAFATCNFTACAGALQIGDCVYGTCTGMQRLFLLDTSGTEIATNAESTGGCFYSYCAHISYVVPPGCHNYTLFQGCHAYARCAGTMGITGMNISVIDGPVELGPRQATMAPSHAPDRVAPTRRPTVFIVNATALCPADYTLYEDASDSANNLCYRHYAAAMMYSAAVAQCDTQGGQLALISSSPFNALIADLSVEQQPQWIGLSYDISTGFYKWNLYASTPQAHTSNFNNWCPGQPNPLGGSSNCGLLLPISAGTCPRGSWISTGCEASYPFTCTTAVSYFGDSDDDNSSGNDDAASSSGSSGSSASAPALSQSAVYGVAVGAGMVGLLGIWYFRKSMAMQRYAAESKAVHPAPAIAAAAANTA